MLQAAAVTQMYLADAEVEETQLRQRVLQWREDMNASLGIHIKAPLDWDEAQAEVVGWPMSAVGLRAIRMLSAYAQHSDLDWPAELPDQLDGDLAWQKASAEDFSRSQFPQVQIPKFWLPGDFDLTMRQPLPDGKEIVMGSLAGLLRQCRSLNQNTLQLEQASLLERGGTEPQDSGDFLAQAGYALAVFLLAANKASFLHVPLRLQGI